MQAFQKIAVLKRVLWVSGGLLALLVSVAIVCVNLVDLNAYKPTIVKLVKQHTGRDLKLSGDIEIIFLPWLGVKTGRVEFANAKGFGPRPMLTLEDSNLYLKLLPLLKKQIKIGSMVLQKPQVNLARNADNLANWHDLNAKLATADIAKGKKLPSVALLGGLTLQDISLVDGALHWDDRFNGKSVTLNSLYLEADKLTPGSAADIDLSVQMRSGTASAATEITFASTATLATNLKTVAFENTEFRATTPTRATTLSLPTASFAVRTGLVEGNELHGKMVHGDGRVLSNLQIPKLFFSWSGQKLRVPSFKLQQGNSSAVGALAGQGVLSGMSAMRLRGNADIHINDVAELLQQNKLAWAVSSNLFNTAVANFQFTMAASTIDLVDLVLTLPDGKPPMHFEHVVLPFRDTKAGMKFKFNTFLQDNKPHDTHRLGALVLSIMQ